MIDYLVWSFFLENYMMKLKRMFMWKLIFIQVIEVKV